MAIPFPDIDPVLVSFGPLAVSWYSLSYVAGIILAIEYIKYLNRKLGHPLDKKFFDDLITWSILGIVIGGRLGYVFIYAPSYYLSNPSEIIKTWNGGMSFHGGLVGLITATYLLSRKYKANFLLLTDLIASAAPIGLFLGRIANFINGELYGRTTDAPWGVIFPNAGPLPRHPSQIYESLTEGLILFIIMSLLFHYTKFKEKHGALFGVFLIGYSIFRTLIENFREPDSHIGFLFKSITMGQTLSLPMLILGGYLILRQRKDATI
jgi:phosphatidylglycerol:prolipoprotein diacylglycerol transferase